VSTIADILKRNGFISEEASSRNHPINRFERVESNELWQMDFKGQFQLGTKESCYPLTILDDHSRFSLCLHAGKNEDMIPVKNQLIIAFKQFGLPKQINVDNGRPWGNSCLVKHTQLTVWLLRLNILVTHSRPRHPQTNGKIERFHRTLKEDVLHKQRISNYAQAQKLFNQWRKIYNYERPHEAIAMRVPADCYEPSPRPLPDKLETIEYDSGATIRKVTQKGSISFEGKDYYVGKAFSGYYLEIKADEVSCEVELYLGRQKIQTSDLR
jgi:transposase InsO family protein